MKHLFIKILIVLFISTTAYSGSFKDFMDNVGDILTDSGTTWGEGASEYSTQGRHGYSGGGFHMKAPSGSITLAKARGPSVKAGCTGIDIDLGAIEFLADKERLVKFLEQVVAGMPGYAFNLAMQTFCPQCTELLNKLNSLANMINGMQFDSCAVLDKATQFGSNMLNKAYGVNAESVKNNPFDKFFGAAASGVDGLTREISGYINTVACGAFGEGNNCPIEFLDPKKDKSALKLMLDNYGSFNDPDSVGIFRYMLGDVKAEEGEKSIIIKNFYPPLSTTKNSEISDPALKKYLEDWIFPCNADAGPCPLPKMDVATIPDSFTWTTESKDIPRLGKIVEEHIKAILNAYLGREEIPTRTLIFLTNSKIPVYQIINQLSVEPEIMTGYLNDMQRLLAAEMAYSAILSISSQVRKYAAHTDSVMIASGMADDVDQQFARAMLGVIKDQLGSLSKASYEIYIDEYNTFVTKAEQYEKKDLINKRFEAQLARSPLYGAAHLSKGLMQW